MIRSLYRWYRRTFHREDPARDERERARDLAERRVLSKILACLRSKDPLKQSLGQHALKLHFMAWMMRRKR